MSEFNRIIAELEQRKVNIERALAILKDLDSTDSELFEQQPGTKTRTSRKTVTWIMRAISVPSVGRTRLMPPVIE